MKPEVGSTFTPQAAHPPAEGSAGIPQAGQPVLPIIPIIPLAAARPPIADDLIKAVPTQDFNLARDLTLFSRVLRQAEGGRWVMAIFVASTVVTIANMFGQVELNDWNGRFFDAVGRKRPVGLRP
jgi:vitamin B12/bleomycin/antimicrobial peptide transport system ATP-binding/permease protein